MSALLSPPKPVRTRFKVPGEGAYELNADIPPPTPRLYPPPPASPAPAPKPAPAPASLGLPKVTKLSFAHDAVLHARPPDPPPLFSLRKLTASFPKFSADDDIPAPPKVARRDRPGVLAYNAGDSLLLVDLARVSDACTLTPKAAPVAHALSPDGSRLLVGSTAGDVVVYDVPRKAPIFAHAAHPARVVAVAWVPHSPRFVSVHADAALVVYDTRVKTPDEPRAATRRPAPHEIVVARGKRSLVTVWRVGASALTACAFSPAPGPDHVALALTGRDGYLRVVDFLTETPLLAFRSYFGALLCVAWSPDGKYVATGGEDDLVSIFSPAETRLVARLEGHTSWVSAVAWDASLSAPGRYRVGSAGQDAKLLLWDFSLDVLHRPTPRTSDSVVRLRSYRRESSANGVNGDRKGKLSLRRHTPDEEPPPQLPTIISAPGRAEVPIVEPVVAHVAHGEPLTDVWFQECGVFTADAVGGVKMWSRPPQHCVPEISLGRGGNRGAADLD